MEKNAHRLSIYPCLKTGGGVWTEQTVEQALSYKIEGIERTVFVLESLKQEDGSQQSRDFMLRSLLKLQHVPQEPGERIYRLAAQLKDVLDRD